MSGVFEGDIFAGPRVGYGGVGADEERPSPAPRSGDGLLPSETGTGPAPKWLPWALIGGGALIAIGIVSTAARRPRANRRRSRRRRGRR